MFKPFSLTFLISTLFAIPALAGSITYDAGNVSPSAAAVITHDTVNSLGAGAFVAAQEAGLDGSKLAPASLRAALLGCAAPDCTAGVSDYVSLNGTYKYFTLTASAPNGTPDNFVMQDDTQNRSSVPEPATFALLGFGALGLLALRRSRPSLAI